MGRYIGMLSAGLAGSPQMISATVQALTRVVFEFKGKFFLLQFFPFCGFSSQMSLYYHFILTFKALDTFGNCQRPVFFLGVSQYMH